MTADSVTLDITPETAVITLDAPPLNIFDLSMRDGLIDAMSAIRELPDISAVILRTGGKHFGAGADLSEFGSAPSNHEARRIRWDRDPWTLLWELPMPTIAALAGVAVGSGLEMALLCDIRIAGPTVTVGLPETGLGMLPAAGGTQSLTRAIGPHRAVPLVALAENLNREEALARGVVTESNDDPDERARELAARFATFDRDVLAALKRCLRAAGDLNLAPGLTLERRLSRAVGPGSATRRPGLR